MTWGSGPPNTIGHPRSTNSARAPSAQDETAARAAQRLVRRGSDDVRVRDWVEVASEGLAGHQPGEMRHVDHEGWRPPRRRSPASPGSSRAGGRSCTQRSGSAAAPGGHAAEPRRSPTGRSPGRRHRTGAGTASRRCSVGSRGSGAHQPAAPSPAASGYRAPGVAPPKSASDRSLTCQPPGARAPETPPAATARPRTRPSWRRCRCAVGRRHGRRQRARRPARRHAPQRHRRCRSRRRSGGPARPPRTCRSTSCPSPTAPLGWRSSRSRSA